VHHLYHYGDDGPYPLPIKGDGNVQSAGRTWVRKAPPACSLVSSHLSDDVGYRFSNRGWSGYPLYANTYADWISNTWGDLALLGWDFEHSASIIVVIVAF